MQCLSDQGDYYLPVLAMSGVLPWMTTELSHEAGEKRWVIGVLGCLVKIKAQSCNEEG